jgi:hypothetical protein
MLLQAVGESSTTHFFEIAVAAFGAAATCMTPILLYVWSNKKSAKADVERRHQENQAALTNINTTLQWNPPHAHSEDDNDGPSVPLMSGKIRYGPRKVS